MSNRIIRDALLFGTIIAFQFLIFDFSINDFIDGNVIIIGPIAVISIFIYIFIRETKKRIGKSKKGEYEDVFSNEIEFTDILIQYVSLVIRADDKRKDSEFRYIEKSLIQCFSEKKTKEFMDKLINKYLISQLSVDKLNGFVLENFKSHEKIHLFYVLVGVATADKNITKKELSFLKSIAYHIMITELEFNSILALFYFKEDWRVKEEQAQKRAQRERQEKWDKDNNKRREGPRKFSLEIDQAYKILEIKSPATVRQIKKAYRKMALKHHPDRVSHLGPEYLKTANEKIIKINEAYDFIKEKLKFK